MKKAVLLAIVALVVVLSSLASFAHIPTPSECATGNYNGVTMDGPPGRGAVCVGAMGHNVVYAGGNAGATCGTIIVADQTVTGDPTADPNDCP